ncbi:hypothetical protein [Haloferula luteola]|nr:hypothetical protein [Haloferula luteola]
MKRRARNKAVERQAVFNLVTEAQKLDSPPTAQAVLRRLAMSPYSKAAFGVVRPLNFTDIEAKSIPLLSPTWEDECRWQLSLFQHASEYLNSFLEAEDGLNKDFLQGRIAETPEQIQSLSKPFGASLWAIGRLFTWAALSGGAEKVVHELGRVVSVKGRPLQTFITQWLGLRSDRTQPASALPKRLEELFSKKDGIEGIYSFTKGILLNNDTGSFTKVFDTFHSLNRFPLIDRYLFIRRLLFSILHREQKLPEGLTSTILGIAESINDPFFKNLSSFVLGGAPPALKNPSVTLLDQYTLGHYDSSMEGALELVVEHPGDLLYYLLAAKSASILKTDVLDALEGRIPQDSVSAILLKKLQTLYSSASAETSTKAELDRLVLDLDCPSLGFGIADIVSDVPQLLGGENRPAWALFSRDANPLLLERFQVALPSADLQSVYSSTSPTIALYTKKTDENAEGLERQLSLIPTERLARIKAQALYRERRLEEATNALEPMHEGDDFRSAHCTPRDRLLLKYLLIDALQKTSRLDEALDLCVTSCLHDRITFSDLPIEEILIKVDFSKSPAVLGSPSRTILMAEYGYEAQAVHSSLNSYLHIRGVTKPSDLLSDETSDADVLLLSHCTRQVLAFSLAFTNTSEINQERITLCEALEASTLNKRRKAQIGSELEEMMGELFLERATEEVDASKIYIDIESLKEIMLHDCADIFARIQTYRSVKVRLYKVADLLDEAEVSQKKELESVQYLTSIHVDAASSEFANLFSQLREEYLWNRNHGLNPNLSMTLRHGTLLGQIRKPFQDCRLVTELEHSSNKYKDNEHWKNELSLDANSYKELNEAFSNLAENVDLKCEDIRQLYIQIKKDSLQKPELALFDFNFEEEEVQALWEEESPNKEKPHELIDIALDKLNQRLSECLLSVRNFFESDISNQLLSYLSDFEVSLSKIALIEHDSKTLLRELARCRTEVQDSMKLIASWFTIQEGSRIPQFTFEQLFNFSCEQLQRVSPRHIKEFEIVTNDTLQIDGRHFSILFHLLYILLSNALRHSHLPADELVIFLDTSQDDTTTVIKVRNLLAEGIDANQLAEHVASEICAKATDAAGELVSKEGGTGFAKIWRILRIDLDSDEASLSCTAPAKDEICLQVTIPTKSLTAHQDEHTTN